MGVSVRLVSSCLLTCIALAWLMSLLDYAFAVENVQPPPHPSSENDSDSERVNLSVYYESLCPYCASFIVNQLVKIFQTDLVNTVHLRLVPWGNTQIQPNNTWICQHGIDECRLDVAEACAINVWPNVQMHYKFIYCVERLHLMNRHTQWQSCFGSTGLEPEALHGCYNNGVGYQLEKAYADETANLNPRHRFVPWVVVNDYPLQEDFQNFLSYICKAYRGSNVPDACTSSTTNAFRPINSPEVGATFSAIYTTSLHGGKD